MNEDLGVTINKLIETEKIWVIKDFYLLISYYGEKEAKGNLNNLMTMN